MLENKQLFNPRTIKRLLTQSKDPTYLQKHSSKEWLKLLSEDKLRDEKANYFKFAEIILRDILGYNIKEFSHEEGNMEFFFKDKLGKPLVVFEVKGTKTKDLWASQHRDNKKRETPVDQICDYVFKNEIPYGILTNYNKFVLFDRSKSYKKYYEFSFEDIKQKPEKLKEFITIFSKKSIESKFIEKLKKESSQEDKIFTKEFYKLYHETRLMLLKEFEESTKDKKKSLHYAQLFLNRLMFILFAEDTDKLPKRIFEISIINTLEKRENEIYDSSYLISTAITNLFNMLNTGNSKLNIPYYNGGLFKDEIPRDIRFKDYRSKKYFEKENQKSILKQMNKLLKDEEKIKTLILKHDNKLSPITINLLIMASYDFKTEVNVNILGHIFEQSLSDLENLQENKVSKRKKDGIYYTPEYITDYICRNTIIPYISKTEDNTNIPTLITDYKDNINELEEKIKKLRILDPACGSGAFLIKAVDVLLEVYKDIEEFKNNKGKYLATKIKAKGKKERKGKDIKGQSKIIKFNAEDRAREIIENCIYGVDLNEESVEITKLSLFLKIARKGKKLPKIDNKIKCGNSLIDDTEVAGDKAFNWKEQFPDIVRKKYKVTIDTNINQNKIKKIEDQGYIKIIKPLFENKSKKIKLKENTNFFLKYSKLGVSELGDSGIDFSPIQKIIGKENTKDAIIFHTHLKAKSDILLTNDKDILSKKEILEKKYSTKIFNPKELDDLINREKIKGFDIVIGNPPYVRATSISYNEKKYYKQKYNTAKEQFDLYYLFYELSHNLLNNKGYFGYINPIGFLNNKSGFELRKIIINNTNIKSIINVSNDNIFKDALTYPILLIYNKNYNKNNNIIVGDMDYITNRKDKLVIKQKNLKNENYIINLKKDDIADKIINKINNNTVKLGKISTNFRGMQINKIKLKQKNDYIILDSNEKKYSAIHLRNINKWYAEPKEYIAIHNDNVAGSEKRKLFLNEKILIPRFVLNLQAAYDKNNYILDNIYILIINNDNYSTKFITNLFNSKLYNYYYKIKYSQTHISGNYFAINGQQLNNILIPKLSKEQQKPFIEKADLMINLNKEYYNKINDFFELLISNYDIQKETNKLKEFYKYEFKDLLNELKKQKIEIKISNQHDLLDIFNKFKQIILTLREQIDKIDDEINQMVYKLYNLTSEEIKIIEESK